jgi:hypothetical protein
MRQSKGNTFSRNGLCLASGGHIQSTSPSAHVSAASRSASLETASDEGTLRAPANTAAHGLAGWCASCIMYWMSIHCRDACALLCSQGLFRSIVNSCAVHPRRA